MNRLGVRLGTYTIQYNIAPYAVTSIQHDSSLMFMFPLSRAHFIASFFLHAWPLCEVNDC
jgi:hypothetical protein